MAAENGGGSWRRFGAKFVFFSAPSVFSRRVEPFVRFDQSGTCAD
jgi:hypothetical protein